MKKLLHFLAHNPKINIIAGLVLVGTAGYEIVIAFEESNLHSEWGMVVYGVMHIFRVLPELVHGAEKLV